MTRDGLLKPPAKVVAAVPKKEPGATSQTHSVSFSPSCLSNRDRCTGAGEGGLQNLGKHRKVHVRRQVLQFLAWRSTCRRKDAAAQDARQVSESEVSKVTTNKYESKDCRREA